MPTYCFSKKQFIKWLTDGLEDDDVIVFSDAMSGNLQAKKKSKSVTFEFAAELFKKPGIGAIAFGGVRAFSFMKCGKDDVTERAFSIIAEQENKFKSEK